MPGQPGGLAREHGRLRLQRQLPVRPAPARRRRPAAPATTSARTSSRYLVVQAGRHLRPPLHRELRQVRARTRPPTGATSAPSTPTGRPTSTSPASSLRSTSTTPTGGSGPTRSSSRPPSSSTTTTSPPRPGPQLDRVRRLHHLRRRDPQAASCSPTCAPTPSASSQRGRRPPRRRHQPPRQRLNKRRHRPRRHHPRGPGRRRGPRRADAKPLLPHRGNGVTLITQDMLQSPLKSGAKPAPVLTCPESLPRKPAMRVLFVASEVFPLIKTGGLADVVAGLPPRSPSSAWTCASSSPVTPRSSTASSSPASAVRLGNIVGGGHGARLLYGRAGNLQLLVLDCPAALRAGRQPLHRPRRPRLARQPPAASARSATPRPGSPAPRAASRWRPDVIHGHDWQSGLAAAYVAADSAGLARAPGTDARPSTTSPTRASISQGDPCPSCACPGACSTSEGPRVPRSPRLPQGRPLLQRQAHHRQPHLRAPDPDPDTYGHGLRRPVAGPRRRPARDLERHRHRPVEPGHTTRTSSPTTTTDDPFVGKRANKQAVQTRFGLQRDPTPRSSVVVSRLVTMKGLDLLISAGSTLLRRGAQLAVLGSGESEDRAGLRRRRRPLARTHRRAPRLRRAARPPPAGRRRRDRRPLAHRAVRPDPDVRPALRHRSPWSAAPAASPTPSSTPTPTTSPTSTPPASSSTTWTPTPSPGPSSRTIDLYHHQPLWRAMVRPRHAARTSAGASSAARYAAIYRNIARPASDLSARTCPWGPVDPPPPQEPARAARSCRQRRTLITRIASTQASSVAVTVVLTRPLVIVAGTRTIGI
jgi:starch synthase